MIPGLLPIVSLPQPEVFNTLWATIPSSPCLVLFMVRDYGSCSPRFWRAASWGRLPCIFSPAPFFIEIFNPVLGDQALTIHVDLLRQFDKLHLSRHVPHCPHEVAQIFAADIAILVLVKLIEGLTELCFCKTGAARVAARVAIITE